MWKKNYVASLLDQNIFFSCWEQLLPDITDLQVDINKNISIIKSLEQREQFCYVINKIYTSIFISLR